MDEHNADRSLQLLVAELLYKNQLLREAIIAKDQTIDLIVNQLMPATVLACSCGVRSQLVLLQDTAKLRELDFATRQNCCLGDWGDIVPLAAGDSSGLISTSGTTL